MCTIYPYPSNEIINIKSASFNQLTVHVIDVTGMTILKQALVQHNLDLSSQVTGIYYIKVLNKAGEVVHAQSVLIKR